MARRERRKRVGPVTPETMKRTQVDVEPGQAQEMRMRKRIPARSDAAGCGEMTTGVRWARRKRRDDGEAEAINEWRKAALWRSGAIGE